MIGRQSDSGMDNERVSERDVPARTGTPLTPGATRVMLLGSGELGKEVIIAFQRLGVEVIAVDRYDMQNLDTLRELRL